MGPALLLSVAVTSTACAEPEGPMALVVTSKDAVLRAKAAGVERHLRRAFADRVTLLAQSTTRQVLSAEGDRSARALIVADAKDRLAQAMARFRELEDRAALELIAKITTRLSAVSQSQGAVKLLAQAHLLAGAIFLARDRVDAAQARLRRALQLDPNIEAPPNRYARRVRAELVALRTGSGPEHRLDITLAEPAAGAEVYVDGRPRGQPPVRLEIPVGRHLVRISAPGRRTFHTTVLVRRDRPTRLEARLAIDTEVRQIANVAGWLNDPEAREQTIALIARRAGVESVLLAELRLDEQRGTTATATFAAVLRLDDRPPQTTSLRTESLQESLTALLTCAKGRTPPQIARRSSRGHSRRSPASRTPSPPAGGPNRGCGPSLQSSRSVPPGPSPPPAPPKAPPTKSPSR